MKQRLRGVYLEYRALILFVALMAVFRSAVADWNDVPSGSMLPTIREGDRIHVDKLAYDVRLPFTHLSLLRIGDPRRGDIVVFDSARAGLRLVKRVVGLPGDVIALQDNRLSINGHPAHYELAEADTQAMVLWESFEAVRHALQWHGSRDAGDFGPIRVPAGHYLVLGDNRDNSADSRVHGFVPREEIVGRVPRVVISLDYDRYLLPRADRFMLPLD